MKYYSRSPKEVHEHSDRAEEATRQKRKKGLLFLAFDGALILIVLLFLFGNFGKRGLVQNNSKPTSKSFEWGGIKIHANCLNVKRCSLELTGERENLRQFTGVKWSIIEKSSDETLFETTLPLKELPIKQNQRIEFVPPFAPSSTRHIRVALLDAAGNSKISFRVYP